MALNTESTNVSAVSSLAIETQYADGWQAGTGCFYFGEMTTVQRDMWLTLSKSSLRNGATIFNITTNSLQTWDETNLWQSISGNAASNIKVVNTDDINDGDVVVFHGNEPVDGKYQVEPGNLQFLINQEAFENNPNVSPAAFFRFGKINIENELDSISFFLNADTICSFARISDTESNDYVNMIVSGGTVTGVMSSSSPSAFFEIVNGALLLGRLENAAAINALPTPVGGMMAFNTETKKFVGYDGIEWSDFSTNTAITILEKLPLETAAEYQARAVAYEADNEHRFNGSIYMVLPYGVGLAAQNGFLRIFTTYEIDPAAPTPVTVSGWRSVPIGAISTLPAAE